MKPRNQTDSPVHSCLDSVRDNEIMPSELCRKRLGKSPKAWREMKRRGLPVVQDGKREYVLGADVLAYFRAQAQAQAEAKGQ